MLFKCKALAFVILSITLTQTITPASDRRERSFNVVTYNMYVGTDFADIFSAQTGAELVSEVAEAYSDMLASRVDDRAEEVADQIEAAQPVLVSLQEVGLWRTGPVFDPAAATDVSVDALALLLASLEARGLNYAAVAVQTNLDAELPAVFGPAAALDIRFTDRVVILARTDLRTSEFKLESTNTGTFPTLLPVSSPAIGTILIPRGWASADVKMRGKNYRFIAAHLEAFYDPVQYAQAYELAVGPAATDKAVILAADTNSDAAANGASYLLLTSAGFVDAWTSTQPTAVGLTWPLSAESPAVFMNPTQRIDQIMTKGDVAASATDLLGEDPLLDLTSLGLRPSDHAGVKATLALTVR